MKTFPLFQSMCRTAKASGNRSITVRFLMLRYWARECNEDGKSFRNPQHGILSKAYEEFPDPLEKGHRGGFDIHIYHYQVGLLLLPLLLSLHARCLDVTYFSTRRRP
ncbi:dopa 4,5-dioxygenase family domain-containing protein [Histoplasma capsulatum var. duboisii H88]|uniref:Dopa 4,5-dioxygenase family domain-containing protein n=1 Tax=Ajellomyces capsulatus (strain H88) TaxID=544711 RepID=A0A8A1LG58_AJEC8|nr:dopa 4,5-dioxygenase family domain-containing protein [Histoplasma capsulatum var. duboisii H88]